ncbi:hypothetical protein [Brevundimonas sp.]|uniref:hypothetical protein n=1 Tax=Brevundimonas sp. TaxID=1871086 RepID=UPI003A8F87DA
MPQSTDKPQADKFREIARELECDEDEAAFEDKVRKMDFEKKPDAHKGDPD